ncbi:MAG: hypothetical protein HY023_08540 [Chloroflexi bacterium]|nr:hypothetical protein [Chloroflexota bacterium]
MAGFALALMAVLVAAIALTLGAADPKPVGQLRWDTDFHSASEAWSSESADGAQWIFGQDGVRVAFTRKDAVALTIGDAAQLLRFPASPDSFTFEVRAAQIAGVSGALYGIIFDFADARHYSALVVNGNGYARAYRVEGGVETDWFPLAQWPPVQVSGTPNRLRVDVNREKVTLRINDEVLSERDGEAGGGAGLIARSFAPGQVVLFMRARLWALTPLGAAQATPGPSPEAKARAWGEGSPGRNQNSPVGVGLLAKLKVRRAYDFIRSVPRK